MASSAARKNTAKQTASKAEGRAAVKAPSLSLARANQAKRAFQAAQSEAAASAVPSTTPSNTALRLRAQRVAQIFSRREWTGFAISFAVGAAVGTVGAIEIARMLILWAKPVAL